MAPQKRKERTFGSELRRIRRSHPDNLTLADTAEQIGCTVSMMSAIENGLRNPPNPTAIKALMTFLDATEQTEEMIRLAAESRGTVEFDLTRQGDAAKEALLTLKRLSDENAITPEVADAILKSLKGG